MRARHAAAVSSLALAGELSLVRGPNRVLFGSDFSINDPSAVLARFPA